jgi:hypothetical protein
MNEVVDELAGEKNFPSPNPSRALARTGDDAAPVSWAGRAIDVAGLRQLFPRFDGDAIYEPLRGRRRRRWRCRRGYP